MPSIRARSAPEADRCETVFVNRDRVERVRENSKPDDTIRRLAETFHVLSDPTRVRILFALAEEELCVCDLSSLLGASASSVSHHLRHLRDLRLVNLRREGRMVYYALADDHVRSIFREGLRHVEEGPAGAAPNGEGS
jgi:DNA-binding transcriptional ArsR family regulator